MFGILSNITIVNISNSASHVLELASGINSVVNEAKIKIKIQTDFWKGILQSSNPLSWWFICMYMCVRYTDFHNLESNLSHQNMVCFA